MNAASTNPYDGLSKAIFDELGWPALLSTAPLSECHEYTKLFADKAKTLEQAKRGDQARAAMVLMELASFAFRPNEEAQSPFQPWIIWEGRRSAAPEDFPEALITVIATLAPEAGNPEFSARLGDVAIGRMPKKDPRLIAATVELYLEAGTKLFLQGSVDAAYLRFRRATQLARRPSPEIRDRVKAAFDNFLQNIAQRVPLLEVTQMLELYSRDIEGDAAKLGDFANAFAKKAEEEKQWCLRYRLLTLVAFWLSKQGKAAEAKAARYDAAETHYALAKEALQRPTPAYSVAADHLMRASTAHRAMDKASPRAVELDKLRAEYQKQWIQQVKPVDLADRPGAEGLRHAIEIGERLIQSAALEAAQAARGLPFFEVVRLLALCHPPPDKAKQGSLALEDMKSAWAAILPMTLFDEDGRPFAKAGSFLHSNLEGRKLVIEQRMLRWFKTYHVPETVTIFEAIREQLNDEHNILPEFMEPIVANSPFIPEGHGYLFARGLYAGLIGDFPLAGTFLASQLEHAIRFNLQPTEIFPQWLRKLRLSEPLTLIIFSSTSAKKSKPFLELTRRLNLRRCLSVGGDVTSEISLPMASLRLGISTSPRCATCGG